MFILECPLCFKYFPSPELRANHIKKCGKSKGLSTQCIVKALELQERHALEIISLGLPAKPIKAVKSNKSTVPKRAIVEPKTKAQSDIQLAKALYLSLPNSNKQNEEENLSNITFVSFKPPTAEQHPGKKNKKIIATPLIVLRTEEERKKLLLDKVATVVSPQNVIDDDSPMDVECDLNKKKRENPNMLPLLWQLSGKTSENHEYYVESLLDWIQPSDVEVGAKLCHLSQIAGHEIVTQLPCDYTFSTQDEQNTCEPADHLHSSPSLIGSLGSLVASSWMSDVDIHTACGFVIPAHRLLLAIRCPLLKQDVDFCSKIGRVSLKWENTSFDVALQFLNFIYTGSIEIEDSMKSDLLQLANKYEVSDLLKLLLTNENNSKQPDIELNEKVAEDIGTKSSSFTRSYHHQSQLEMEENNICETQEETNMDLDIVYNCINSSLKPPQPHLSRSLTQKAETSSQYLNEPKNKSHGCIDLNCSKPESVENSPQKCTFYNHASQEQGSTSPVIFDVNDSDNEEGIDSENESIELPANCSQNSNLEEYHLEEKELDLCSTESNNSQDPVNFLQSSISAYKSSWPLNKAASPEALICDSDSNPKSPMSIPDEEVMHDHEKEEFPPSSQIKFNFSQISEGSAEISLNSTLSKNLPGDIFEHENNFNSHPSTSNGLANSPCSVSPLKRNVKSPVVICFSSDDDDEQITTGQSSSKTVFSSDHKLQEFEGKVSCTNLPSEKVTRSMHVGSLKSLSTSFEHYEDPPYECNDYFEPDISPLQSNDSSPSKPIVSEFTPQRKMESVKENHKPKTVTPSSVPDPQFRLSDSPITPFPDYKNMATPGIKEALQRIGVKALPRKKALELLKHVYNETHPLVYGEGSIEKDSPERVSKTEKLKKRKKLKEDAEPAKRKQVEVNSPEKLSATQESDDSGSENPEWQGCVPEISFTQFTQDSPTKATKDDLDLIKQYIQSSEELYSNILTYTPLNLVVFHQELKENGIKISIQKLMDFFDEQCITFTCPRKEEYKKKQNARTQRFRKDMIAKLSQQTR